MKHANEEERQNFAQNVFRLINPKFESETEGKVAFGILMEFSAECELTAMEFIQALKLSAQGKLIFEDANGISTPVKILREIDFIKLNEVAQAYIQHRNRDKMHQEGEAKIHAFLNPPKVETEEEKKANRERFYRSQYRRLQEKGEVLGDTEFYPLLMKKHDMIKLKFVDDFLKNFKPETAKKEGGILGKGGIKVIKHDVHLAFKKLFVEVGIKKYNLQNLSEDKWVAFWEELYQLKI